MFATAWRGHRAREFGRVLSHSPAYVCAYDGERDIGFVNVASDGATFSAVQDVAI